MAARIGFFGASLDALDTPEAIQVKRSFIERFNLGGSSANGFRDPYGLLRGMMKEFLEGEGHRFLGRFAIESWLTPTPKPEDARQGFVTEGTYHFFLRNEGYKIFAEMVRDFVKAHIFPFVPGMIGVDHSLTGGVLMALSERLGAQNLGVLVFDAHTDAVPLSLRRGLVQYAAETGNEGGSAAALEEDFNPYSAGSFLLCLMDRGTIRPENLVLVGVGDCGKKLRGVADRRVQAYVRHYDSLYEWGVKIIDKDLFEEARATVVENTLARLQATHLYVSLDVDVSAECGVLASRFTDIPGCEMSLVLESTAKVKEFLDARHFALAGLDVMEMDIHKIDATLRSGLRDQTAAFVQSHMALLGRNEARGGTRDGDSGNLGRQEGENR